ncbi:MAG: response regulator [Synechococcaceae cyanobacterium RM1_1_27]|nr:response regulator [Synechococcaceae cyanobacterium SM2_3_2]NJO85676.1 response regulator [Synechococcaceae cyanobacterium RM1_1_27]
MVSSVEQTSATFDLVDPVETGLTWQVMVSTDNRQLFYATASHVEQGYHLERLQCLLPLFGIQVDQWPQQLACGEDYQFIYQLMFAGPTLGLRTGRELLLKLAQEAYCHCLVVRQEQAKPARRNKDTISLSPILVEASVAKLNQLTKQRVKVWQELRHWIPSPFSRLRVDPSRLSDLVDFWQGADPTQPIHKLELTQITRWGRLLQEGSTVYRLAANAGLAPTVAAQSLVALMQAGWVELGQPSSPTAETAVATICCIDDSKAVAQSISDILTPEGYRVVSLQDPLKALAYLEDYQPDLVLLDILMPELNGYELCRMIRQNHVIRAIPIAFLTGKDGLFDKLRAKLLGVKDYMTKPIEPTELHECVKRLLAQSRCP